MGSPKGTSWRYKRCSTSSSNILGLAAGFAAGFDRALRSTPVLALAVADARGDGLLLARSN